MIFEDEKKTGAATATPNRDKPREPIVIDATAEAAPEPEKADETASAEPPADEVVAAPPIEQPRAADSIAPPPPHARSRLPLIAALLGGAALAIGGAAALHMYQDDAGAVAALSQKNISLEERLAKLEKLPAAIDPSALQALDKRIAALEQKPAPAPVPAATGASADAVAALDKRIAALEADVKSARAEAAQARTLAQQNPAPAQRSGEPVAPTPRPAPEPPPAVNIAPLEARIAETERKLAALESSLAGAKTEIRATQTESAEASTGASRATVPVVAQALLQALDRGQPIATEIGALRNLGVEPQKLAALDAAARGLPTAAQLRDQFGPLAPAIARFGEAPAQEGSITDRLLRSAASLVKVRPVGETAGDAPAAIASRIEGALGRGDLKAALAAWKSLPEGARGPSAAWASALENRIKADEAARAIMTEAVERLGQKPN